MNPERSDTTSGPVTTEEDQILESIDRLRVEIDRIESTTGPSRRTQCIRDEVKRLGIRLARCKMQSVERTGHLKITSNNYCL
jgi:hypothetical protein